jgi:hypothetical protein
MKTRKERRRKEAEERQVKYNALTLQERIELAKSRRGSSKREIENLVIKLTAPVDL